MSQACLNLGFGVSQPPLTNCNAIENQIVLLLFPHSTLKVSILFALCSPFVRSASEQRANKERSTIEQHPDPQQSKGFPISIKTTTFTDTMPNLSLPHTEPIVVPCLTFFGCFGQSHQFFLVDFGRSHQIFRAVFGRSHQIFGGRGSGRGICFLHYVLKKLYFCRLKFSVPECVWALLLTRVSRGRWPTTLGW